MADEMPFDIQVEIMKRLPIKSLIRSRSVSKSWKSLINSSKFITNYHVNNTRLQNHLLVNYRGQRYKQKCVLIVDDDTFPQHKVSLDVSMHIKQCQEPSFIGSSQGLLCFIADYYSEESDYDTAAFIWNPSIRKSVCIPIPNELNQRWPYGTVIGFGVCPHTNDPKLVNINYNVDSSQIIPWRVEVFTLSSRVWRSPLCSNMPRNSIQLTNNSFVVMDSFIYWYAYETARKFVSILSFDMTNEEFTEIFLPDSIARDPHGNTSISTLRKSLVVLQYNFVRGGTRVYDVWMMDHISVSKSFTKLYTIMTPISYVFGFRKSGEPIIVMRNDSERQDALFVYEPSSQHIKNIGISSTSLYGEASSYKETLLLLDY